MLMPFYPSYLTRGIAGEWGVEQTKKTQQENNGICPKIESKHSLLGKHNKGGLRIERVKKPRKM